MRLVFVVSLCLIAGCPSADDPPGTDTGGRADVPLVGADAGPLGGTDTPTMSDGGDMSDVSRDASSMGGSGARCGDPVPPGATVPTLAPYSGGVCPMLVPGRNTISSGGRSREFLLVLPSDMIAGEPLPVLVLWHYLGGSANSMLTHGRVQESADALRFIAIIPEKGGDVTIPIPFTDPVDMAWPYMMNATDARVAEEVTFFDDMLACVADAYTIDNACISSVGVSAGALFTAQLMQRRADVLASAIVLSGGVGPASGFSLFDVRGFASASRPVPALVAWGGPMDECAMSFQRASTNLEAALMRQGSFVMECIHNCGHTAPPVDDPTIGLGVLYGFALDHPFWLPPGESPYTVRGMPVGTPEWCGLGVGSATARTGMCPSALESCPVPALGGR